MHYRRLMLPVLILGGFILGMNAKEIYNSRPAKSHTYTTILGEVQHFQEDRASPASREIEQVLHDRTKSASAVVTALDSTRTVYGTDEFAKAAMQAIPDMPKLHPSSLTGALVLNLFTSAVGERNKQLRQNPQGYSPNNPLDYAAMASRPGGFRLDGNTYSATSVQGVYRNLDTGKFERKDGSRMVKYTAPYHNGRPVDIDDPRFDAVNNVMLEDRTPVNRGYEVRESVPGGERVTVYNSWDDYAQQVTAQRVANDPVMQGFRTAESASQAATQRANDAAIHAGRAVDSFFKGLQGSENR